MLLKLTVLIAVLAAVVAQPAAADNGVRYYLSLGDSLAAGFEPTLPPGENFGTEGYADQLYALKRAQIPQLKLVKLGCGGETTGSMSDPFPYEGRGDHFFCSFPHGSQLAEALNFLHAHKHAVAFVTIDIGANDVFTGVPVPMIQANLASILLQLRNAAGPDVRIVGMNYYDPFLPQAWSQGGLPALQAEIAGVTGFNDQLESVYSAVGDPVADVESAFSVTDTTLVNGTPLDVLRECAWTWFCTVGDIHANAAGYGVIAQAFAAALL